MPIFIVVYNFVCVLCCCSHSFRSSESFRRCHCSTMSVLSSVFIVIFSSISISFFLSHSPIWATFFVRSNPNLQEFGVYVHFSRQLKSKNERNMCVCVRVSFKTIHSACLVDDTKWIKPVKYECSYFVNSATFYQCFASFTAGLFSL